MFVDDIIVKDKIYAAVIRSPVPKGILVSVSCPALPEEYTLISACDIPGENRLAGTKIPVLTESKISYSGEPIALIAGEDPYLLEQFVGDCVIIMRGEIPCLSLSAENAEIIELENTGAGKAEINKAEANKNETDKNLNDENVVIHGVYKTNIQEHWTSEPTGAIASFDNGKLVIHTATQWPLHVKESAALVLGLAPESVHVEETDLGICLDGKIWYPSLIACFAALCANKTNKTVKIMHTREDEFLFSPKRLETEIDIETVLDNCGQIQETTINVCANFGGSPFFADSILKNMRDTFLNTYNLGKLKLQLKAVKTNLLPAGAFAGFGSSEAVFALERHIANIADTLREEGADFRQKILQSKKTNEIALCEAFTSITRRSDY
ncbi:MAG: xanthine dehydrogenase family protein molybdopterin-binding subunit, partial [Spirochaetaceae bacterium]|nr:xanthine dehydrogenase family protein molybdopterin-binding subunit [Spirochaetaceae bacterium]